MQKLSCNVCGSQELLKEKDGQLRCSFCLTIYTPAKSQKQLTEGVVKIDKRDDLENLLALTRHAKNLNNYNDIYVYSQKAIELDPQNHEAWFMQGYAAGFMSSISEPRIEEMLKSFDVAAKLVHDDGREKLEQDMSKTAYMVAEINQKYLSKEIDEAILTNGVNIDPRGFFSKGKNYTARLAEYAYQTTFDNEIKVSSMRVTANACVSAVKIIDKKRKHGQYSDADKQRREDLGRELDKANDRAMAIDQSYVPVQLPIYQRGGIDCFVVTATMGNQNSKPVLILRRFRDEVLKDSPGGKAFIGWYYANGPILASHISNSILLRSFSFLIVVIPSTLIAFIWLTILKNLRKL